MASGAVSRLMRAPGRIVIGPTNLSNAYPHGGTEIGKTNVCALQALGTPFRVEYEALGAAGDILEPNKHWVFTCFVRGFDDDAVEKMFTSANYSEGGTTGHAVYKDPGTRVPGEAGIGRGVILLYVPDDLIHVDALLIYNGVPDWQEGADIAFQRGAELGMPLAIDCLQDSNSLTLSIGRFSDLSLTA